MPPEPVGQVTDCKPVEAQFDSERRFQNTMKRFVFSIYSEGESILELEEGENYLSALYQLLRSYDIECTEQQYIDFSFSASPIVGINFWLSSEGYNVRVLRCFEISNDIY